MPDYLDEEPVEVGEVRLNQSKDVQNDCIDLCYQAHEKEAVKNTA